MRAEPDEVEVTPLELLFDLVFAFTTTQLTTLLASGAGVAVPQAILIFLVLFWMYGGYVWLTNQVPVSGIEHRLLLIVAMAGFLICALAIPVVLAEDGVVFGVGYLVVIVVHTHSSTRSRLERTRASSHRLTSSVRSR